MATKGNTSLNRGIPTLKDAFVVIVKTEWNAPIVNKLEAGAKKILKEAGVAFKVLTVPGAVEIPFIIKQYAESIQAPADAFIALGTVMRGDTPHFDYVCNEAAKGVSQASLSSDVPVIFGVLTTETIEQAVERAGTKAGNKGWDAAVTAIEMANLDKSFKKE